MNNQANLFGKWVKHRGEELKDGQKIRATTKTDHRIIGLYEAKGIRVSGCVHWSIDIGEYVALSNVWSRTIEVWR